MRVFRLIAITAFVFGLAIVPSNPPDWVFPAAVGAGFAVLVFTVLVMSWRQGHSGSVILPFRRGPFGWEGLSLQPNLFESRIILTSIAFLAGLLGGLLIVVALS